MLQATAQLMSATYEKRPRPMKDVYTKVSRTLLDVVDVAGKVIEGMSTKTTGFESNDYFIVAALDREMESWYANIPGSIKWNLRNAQVAKSDYFLFQ